ncbi:MAG: L-threonylcarbamoyladenylate synthase [Candidatus Binatia bacterium]|nr:L-threonylcarbamoyladenylate synthase [Candidatus Binatia bacterium]
MAGDEAPDASRREGFRRALELAVQALRGGGAIVYPTETVYALGVRALDPEALQYLVALKVRAANKPISVLVADRGMLDALVRDVPRAAERLMQHFWPGPLTLALPAREHVPEVLTGGSGTIGIRISPHPLAHELVARLGEPITTPSANPAGERPPTTASAAREYFGEGVTYYLDWGPCPGEPVSTVVVVEADQVVLVRRGAIAPEAIEPVAGVPVVA